MHRNVEQVAVSTSWGDADDEYTIRRLDMQFQELWVYTKEEPPQEIDASVLYRRAIENMIDIKAPISADQPTRFHIPSWIRYQDGPFAHQGEAIDAWCNAGYSGVLEMATGAGKTIAAMIGAYRLHQEEYPLLIVIAAPYIPLVQQE